VPRTTTLICPSSPLQKPVASWALGGTEQDFSSAAVYDYASNQCYAPVRPRGKSGGGSGSVLTWSADDTAGSITQLAHPLHLPALHSLFPVSHTPEGEAEEAAAAAAEERAAAEVDGSGERRGGALAVLAGGGLALCSSGEVVAEAEEARGQHTVAAAYQQGVLVLLTSDARSGAVSSTLCRVQVGALHAPQPPAASRSLARLPAYLPVYLPASPPFCLHIRAARSLSNHLARCLLPLFCCCRAASSNASPRCSCCHPLLAAAPWRPPARQSEQLSCGQMAA
jgi:hypothetical protein